MNIDLFIVVLVIVVLTLVVLAALFAWACWSDGEPRVVTDWRDDPETLGDHVELPRGFR